MANPELSSWTRVRILGWSDEQYLALSTGTRSVLEAARRGEVGDKEITTHPEVDRQEIGMIVSEMKKTVEYLLDMASTYCRETFPLSAVQARLRAAHGVVDPTYEHAVYDEVIKSASIGLRMVLEEALMNHLQHGAKFDPRYKIAVKARIKDGFFEGISGDNGEGYFEDPTEFNLEGEGGGGLLLMASFAHELQKKRGKDDGQGCGYAYKVNLKEKLLDDLIRDAENAVKIRTQNISAIASSIPHTSHNTLDPSSR